MPRNSLQKLGEESPPTELNGSEDTIFRETIVYLVQKNQLRRLTKPEYQLLRHLTHLSKNLFNHTLYMVRQYFFAEGAFLQYEQAYHHAKENENYRMWPSQVAQQAMKVGTRSMRSFLACCGSGRRGIIIVRFGCLAIYQKLASLCVYLPKRYVQGRRREDSPLAMKILEGEPRGE
ncbi:MAG: hypothetical protein ACE5R6_17440 [Candidatus Heimdallarchaeota archaeon]